MIAIGLLFIFQTLNDSRALKNRVLKYLIPVTIICIVFNITKFFEISVVYIPVNNTNIATSATMTSGINLTASNINISDLAVVASSVGLIEKDEMMLPLEENITRYLQLKSQCAGRDYDPQNF